MEKRKLIKQYTESVHGMCSALADLHHDGLWLRKKLTQFVAAFTERMKSQLHVERRMMDVQMWSTPVREACKEVFNCYDIRKLTKQLDQEIASAAGVNSGAVVGRSSWWSIPSSRYQGTMGMVKTAITNLVYLLIGFVPTLDRKGLYHLLWSIVGGLLSDVVCAYYSLKWLVLNAV